MDAHGKGAAAAVQGFEGCLQGAAAGVGIGVVQVPEQGDSGGLQQGWGEEVVDYGGDFAGGGGVFGGAEDDPG